MICYQMDLFDPPLSEVDILRKEIASLKESQDRQRKSLFAKHAELMKIVLAQQVEIEKLNVLMMKRIK